MGEEVHQVSCLLQVMVLGYTVGGLRWGAVVALGKIAPASKSGNSGKSGMSDMSGKSGKSDSQGKGIIPIPLTLCRNRSLSKPNVLGNAMGYNSTTAAREARSGNTHRLIDPS